MANKDYLKRYILTARRAILTVIDILLPSLFDISFFFQLGLIFFGQKHRRPFVNDNEHLSLVDAAIVPSSIPPILANDAAQILLLRRMLMASMSL